MWAPIRNLGANFAVASKYVENLTVRRPAVLLADVGRWTLRERLDLGLYPAVGHDFDVQLPVSRQASSHAEGLAVIPFRHISKA